MFWKRKKNTPPTDQLQATPTHHLYPFTASYGYDNVSGLSVEPFSAHKDIAKQITRTFYWNGMCVTKDFQKYWRHAFIYHHDIPSSVSLTTIQYRCYQPPTELQAFVNAAHAYKRAILAQENTKEHLETLKDAKKALLLKVI